MLAYSPDICLSVNLALSGYRNRLGLNDIGTSLLSLYGSP